LRSITFALLSLAMAIYLSSFCGDFF
jgi:hypothetical protein